MEYSVIMLHFTLALVALGFFVIRILPVVLAKTWHTEQSHIDKILFILQHINYSLLFFFGIWLFGRTHFHAAPWFYLKVILIFVLFYLSARGMKRKIVIPLQQRKISLMLGFFVRLSIWAT